MAKQAKRKSQRKSLGKSSGKSPGKAPAILQLVPNMDGGGAEQATLEIARALGRTRKQFVVTAGGGMIPALTRAGARVLCYPIGRKTPWGIWRNARWLADMIRQHNIALIHARSRAPAWVAWLVSRRLGVPYIATYHGRPPARWRFWKCWYNAALVRGRAVIAASRWAAEGIAHAHGLDQRVIRIIARGVAIDAFAMPGRAQCLAQRAAWGVRAGETSIMLPARLTHGKGHAFMLDVLAELAPKHAIRLVFVGAAKHTRLVRQLRSKAARLGVARQVCLAGHSTNMPIAYGAADIVVAPSLAPEPFGRAVIEAQAAGRIVLAAKAGGMAETLPAGTGYALPPGDMAQWLAALRKVLAMSAPARRKLAKAAQAHVRQHYALANMQASTLAVYDALLR